MRNNETQNEMNGYVSSSLSISETGTLRRVYLIAV